MQQMPRPSAVNRYIESPPRPAKSRSKSHRRARRWSATWSGSALAGLFLAGVAACGGDQVVVTQCGLVRSIWVSPAYSSIRVGDTALFVATDKDRCPEDLAPFRAEWSAGDGSVASITSSTDTSVVVSGPGAGQVIVTATAASDHNVKSAGLLTVMPLPAPGAP